MIAIKFSAKLIFILKNSEFKIFYACKNTIHLILNRKNIRRLRKQDHIYYFRNFLEIRIGSTPKFRNYFYNVV